jgi:hypothetical protein
VIVVLGWVSLGKFGSVELKADNIVFLGWVITASNFVDDWVLLLAGDKDNEREKKRIE